MIDVLHKSKLVNMQREFGNKFNCPMKMFKVLGMSEIVELKCVNAIISHTVSCHNLLYPGIIYNSVIVLASTLLQINC